MDGNNKASSIFPSRAGRGARTVSKFVLSCPLPVQKAPPPGARERASESRVPSDANLQTHIRDLLSDENFMDGLNAARLAEALFAQCGSDRNEIQASVSTALLQLIDTAVREYKAQLSSVDTGKLCALADACDTKEKLSRHLVTLISGLKRKRREGHYSLMVSEIIAYIEASYREEISIRETAERFKLSTNYLGQLLKKETGRSFTQLLAHIRIERAKKMLRNPTFRVLEICEAVGYRDYIQFYRIFKKEVGCSPTDFRNSL